MSEPSENQREAVLKVRLESLATVMKELDKQDGPSLGRLDAIPPPGRDRAEGEKK